MSRCHTAGMRRWGSVGSVLMAAMVALAGCSSTTVGSPSSAPTSCSDFKQTEAAEVAAFRSAEIRGQTAEAIGTESQMLELSKEQLSVADRMSELVVAHPSCFSTREVTAARGSLAYIKRFGSQLTSGSGMVTVTPTPSMRVAAVSFAEALSAKNRTSLTAMAAPGFTSDGVGSLMVEYAGHSTRPTRYVNEDPPGAVVEPPMVTITFAIACGGGRYVPLAQPFEQTAGQWRPILGSTLGIDVQTRGSSSSARTVCERLP